MESKVFKPVNTKLYKTGQTRGADDDVIYQNRVKSYYVCNMKSYH